MMMGNSSQNRYQQMMAIRSGPGAQPSSGSFMAARPPMPNYRSSQLFMAAQQAKEEKGGNSLDKLAIDDDPALIKDKNVLMRVDFNVPMKDGKVTDPKRIVSTIPSIQYLLDQGANSVILMSHRGRPDGTVQEKFSLEPIVSTVSKELGTDVQFVPETVGPVADKAIADGKPGQVFLLENLRFNLAEEGKGVVNGEKVKATAEEVTEFRTKLTALGDIYVNDAFGTAHRAHSSMVGVDLETRASGFLLKKELSSFSKVLDKPERPLTVVMGGAKVTDKIKLIYNMLDIVDEMIIGGGMAFTFDKVINGSEIGASLWDEEGAKTIPDIMAKAKEKGVKIHLPTDYLCADKFAEDAKTEVKTNKEGI